MKPSTVTKHGKVWLGVVSPVSFCNFFFVSFRFVSPFRFTVSIPGFIPYPKGPLYSCLLGHADKLTTISKPLFAQALQDVQHSILSLV